MVGRASAEDPLRHLLAESNNLRAAREANGPNTSSNGRMENPRPPASSETIGLAVHDAGPGCSHIFVISSREAENVPWSPRNTSRSASNATNPHSTSYIPP